MFDVASFIKAAGYIGIGVVIFAESGLLIGILLPGDSLLFTAGILASQGYLDIALVCLIAFVAAVSGDSVGYWLGKKFGPRIFTRSDSFFLNTAHIDRARRFFAQYGAKTIILARFMPIVRTLAPVIAGVGEMNYRTFLTFNIFGGVLWGIGLPVIGYWLGTKIPNIDRYLLPIIALIIVLSITPGIYHLLRSRFSER